MMQLNITIATCLCESFHRAPGVVGELADDQVQFMVPKAIQENVLDCGTQMFQNQTYDGGTSGAVA